MRIGVETARQKGVHDVHHRMCNRELYAYYGYPGRRVVGYDNERGKGDHRHLGGREESYRFSGVEALIADFLSDVKRARGAR